MTTSNLYHFDTAHLGIQVYDLLSRPNLEDRDKAKIIAEALETVQQNYPDLGNTATKRDLSETELRLIGEIEKTRKEIKELDVSLRKEMKEMDIGLRGEIKETELRLMGEIEKTRKEIKELDVSLRKEMKEMDIGLRGEIKETELRLMGGIKETELRLMGEIEKTRKEIKELDVRLTGEIKDVEVRLTKEIAKQGTKTIAYLTGIMGLFIAIMKGMALFG